jgi:hypothetical protein
MSIGGALFTTLIAVFPLSILQDLMRSLQATMLQIEGPHILQLPVPTVTFQMRILLSPNTNLTWQDFLAHQGTL